MRPDWKDLPAVRQDWVCAVDANSYFAHFGPRFVKGVELLANLIHPDVCKWTGPSDTFESIGSNSKCSRILRCGSGLLVPRGNAGR
jgi:hypothetical protein